MTEKKKTGRKMRISISKKTLLSILMIAIVLGVTAIVIGYTVYSSTMDTHYLNNTMRLANTSAALVDKDVVNKYANIILAQYRLTTEDEREAQDEDAYREFFDGIEDQEDYIQLRQTLIKIKENNDIMYAYIMVIDKDNSVCLYVCDGDADEETYCPPGCWEPIEDEQADSLKRGNEAVITKGDFGWLSSGGAPIYVSEDGTFSAAIVDISMNDVMNDRFVFLRNYCIILILVIALLSAVMTFNMRRQVVVPINKLAKAAGEYSHDRANIKVGDASTIRDHFSGLNIHTGDELENLSTVMSEMESQITEYIDDLTRVTAEKERIGAELSIATQIQADMLPRIFPAFPDRNEFDLYAIMHPAKEVGGDFYDFFLIDDDHVGLVMADVSGKGVPAALFMVIAKTLIKNRALLGESPAVILNHVNEQLCEGNEAELFVTVWLAVIEISTGKGLAANAGHEHPAIRRANGSYELVVYRHSPAVATMEGLRFKEHEFQLNPGDSLFVYTDGVPEATDATPKLFGNDRMLASLNRNPNASPEELLSNVRRDIDAFVGDAPQFDDITMMGFSYFGSEKKESDPADELTIDATDENLAAVLSFVSERLATLDCPDPIQMQINVAVEELFVNIAHYAYTPAVGSATIRFEKTDDPKAVSITLIDGGIPYDPLAKPDPDVTLSSDDRPIGGLGIYMVKKSMDEVTYEYRDGKNVTKIKKIIPNKA